MATANLLFNGRLAEGFYPFRNNDNLTTAAGWLPWWIPPKREDPQWKNQTPTYEAFELDGRLVQRLGTPWATHTAGLLQQAPAAPGNEYFLTAECLAWSSEAEETGNLVEASDVNVQIGLDPTGGLDPTSPLIIWSEIAQPLGEWQALELEIESQASAITVYLRSAPSLPKRQQAVFWRNVRLEPLGRFKRGVSIVGPGDTHINLSPEQPRPGQRVTATVSSARNQVFIDLVVRRPDNEIAAVAFQGLSQDQGRYTWRYHFAVADAGLYDVRFVGDRGARLLAQQLMRVAEKDALAEAAEQAPSGAPRLDYHRIYVLLPPTADAKWFVAAARGAFDGRYTVGFSADDAGVGDLAGRHILAVNPHHWPETLTAAWFHKHYPGAKFTAVVANSPDDLENWLRNWTEEA
ncbi:MAG: hypothetical protein L0332_26485 [Chloroflexi bacterium]|nr:hypothetical protein [Chloroflexota bacterium]MCI0577877.1 hypothetical protein [Chloroflexota bacterium]MCI0644487.1 hypothetical protein [Chloroflexota bacterium]MCI0730245.1 hypothetical protein [Chloroflexota bacterium]